MGHILFTIFGALVPFLLVSGEEIPPSYFPQFNEVLNKSLFKGPGSGDVHEDLNGYAQWAFKSFEEGGNRFMQMSANGTGHMAILQQMKKLDDGTLERAAWSVNDRNGVEAEILVPEQDLDMDTFTFLSFAADGKRIKFDRDIVLLRLEWNKTYKNQSDVVVLHYRKEPGTGGAEEIVLGPRQNSPQKYMCEVSNNRITFEVDGKTFIDGDELDGWDKTVVWIRAGVVVYDAETEASNARTKFKSINWIEG